ncbi:MAG: hypothetical protein F6K09_07850, partial [Merismopedia sp. SIO2A8]|nr:hypothetical protein [Merismopedia sp. SIO2A8]
APDRLEQGDHLEQDDRLEPEEGLQWKGGTNGDRVGLVSYWFGYVA